MRSGKEVGNVNPRPLFSKIFRKELVIVEPQFPLFPLMEKKQVLFDPEKIKPCDLVHVRAEEHSDFHGKLDHLGFVTTVFPEGDCIAVAVVYPYGGAARIKEILISAKEVAEEKVRISNGCSEYEVNVSSRGIEVGDVNKSERGDLHCPRVCSSQIDELKILIQKQIQVLQESLAQCQESLAERRGDGLDNLRVIFFRGKLASLEWVKELMSVVFEPHLAGGGQEVEAH